MLKRKQLFLLHRCLVWKRLTRRFLQVPLPNLVLRRMCVLRGPLANFCSISTGNRSGVCGYVSALLRFPFCPASHGVKLDSACTIMTIQAQDCKEHANSTQQSRCKCLTWRYILKSMPGCFSGSGCFLYCKTGSPRTAFWINLCQQWTSIDFCLCPARSSLWKSPTCRAVSV